MKVRPQSHLPPIGRLRPGLIALLVAFLTVAAVAQIAPAPDDYRRLNDALVTGHVLPRQAALAEATAGLDEAAAAFCSAPSQAQFERLHGSFGAASDAWQAVQHVRFGPAELFMRSVRFAFWPDPRNTVGRQLSGLLAARDPEAVTQEAFTRGSVAVQGLPALERLLYGEGAAEALLSDGEDAKFRCVLVTAIARNLATIAADLHREWTEGSNSFAATIAQAGPDADRYRAPEEATLDLFKSLYTAVELVADHKLARPLGGSMESARPGLAEASRSGRSLENIRINLKAAEAAYLTEGGFGTFVREVAGDAELDALLTRAFAQTRRTAESIEAPLETAVSDPALRPTVEQLAAEADALKALLVQRLNVALGIPVGFNALDGD